MCKPQIILVIISISTSPKGYTADSTDKAIKLTTANNRMIFLKTVPFLSDTVFIK